ncbi:MAG: Co2+/Mg2+ efflux protein ApaG [Alphaproteobacteria bacterium]|nr:Co2+/Mg2+ efflux protein ApaG [Alphaproteobacteria bacterium]
MYEAVTRGIRIAVTPQFLENESDDRRYFWAYTVIITNESEQTVQLKTRYWQITDAKGHTEEVRGPGVVGETPVLKRGESFTYTSGCPLTEPSGVMVGKFGMIDADGVAFEVDIPAFSLDSPDEQKTLN